METIALYAGSFDPITRGHIDVIEKALKTFDRVEVVSAQNPAKKRLFELNEAFRLMALSLHEHFGFESRIKLDGDERGTLLDGRLSLTFVRGTLVDHAANIGATHIVRGLRGASDINDECNFHSILERMAPDLITAHFLAGRDLQDVSSSTARELAKYDKDTSWLVTPVVAEALRRQFGHR